MNVLNETSLNVTKEIKQSNGANNNIIFITQHKSTNKTHTTATSRCNNNKSTTIIKSGVRKILECESLVVGY